MKLQLAAGLWWYSLASSSTVVNRSIPSTNCVVPFYNFKSDRAVSKWESELLRAGCLFIITLNRCLMFNWPSHLYFRNSFYLFKSHSSLYLTLWREYKEISWTNGWPQRLSGVDRNDHQIAPSKWTMISSLNTAQFTRTVSIILIPQGDKQPIMYQCRLHHYW